MDLKLTDIATEPKPPTGNALISLLYVARGLRGFGDGFAIIILPAYMTALGYDAIAVGIVAAASLLGTALLTLVVGWIAPRHDLRPLLISGAALMTATGIAFRVYGIALPAWGSRSPSPLLVLFGAPPFLVLPLWPPRPAGRAECPAASRSRA